MRISEKNGNSQRKKSGQPTSSSGTQEPNSLGFPKTSRILKRHHYKQIASERKRYLGEALAIDYRTGRTRFPKIGITTSRAFGKSVLRNRFKRLVREAFRLNQHSLFQSVEMSILPKRGVTLFSLETISSDFIKFSEKMHDPSKRGTEKSG